MTAIPTPDPPLQAAELLMRRWRIEDAPDLFDAFTDPDVLAFSWAAERDHTTADAAAFVNDTHAAQLAGRELQLAVVDAGSDPGPSTVDPRTHPRSSTSRPTTSQPLLVTRATPPATSRS